MYPIRVFNYGGGVQSNAALVLAVEGKIDYRTFLFCNVGDDSEHPETLRYVHEVAMPYAHKHDINLIELQKVSRNGTPQTILTTMIDKSFVNIPMYMTTEKSRGAPLPRVCTNNFKVRVAEKWLKEQAGIADVLKKDRKTKIPHPRPLAITAMGISMDEFQRMRSSSGNEWQQLAYPLIDLRLTRADCIDIIKQAGLPIPPKSSCWFCPYHSKAVWQEMRDNQPALFEKVMDLENQINTFRASKGKRPVWFTSRAIPIAQFTSQAIQDTLPDINGDVCDSGYCFL